MHFPAITDKTGPVQPEGCASLDGLRTQALLTNLSRNSLTPVDSEEAPGTGGVQGDWEIFKGHLSKPWARVSWAEIDFYSSGWVSLSCLQPNTLPCSGRVQTIPLGIHPLGKPGADGSALDAGLRTPRVPIHD